MNSLKRAAKRALYYIRQGYSLASLPFAFLGYASSIYYLAIENIQFLHNIFPRFSSFLMVAVSTLPFLCGLIGYAYMKRSWFFREASEIQMESNPYTSVKATNVMLPAFKVFRETAKIQGQIDVVSQLNEIIKRSEKNFKKGCKK